VSDGEELPHRTFFAYRRAIEEQFGITIKCNGANEYYIDATETVQDKAFRDWVLDSYALRSVLDDNRDIASRIYVDQVPSAREYLSPVLGAIRRHKRLRFSYAPFTRRSEDKDIEFDPYFVRLYDRRWYMVGRRASDSMLRTYALDRVTAMTHTHFEFEMPEEPSPKHYFADIYGITQSGAPAHDIKLKADASYAKYLQALPLHESQEEERFDTFSIFRYRMKLTPDLVRHILSLGSSVQVLAPRELRLMVIEELKNTLKNYSDC